MQKSIGLVTELWSPRFVTEYWNVFFPIRHVDYEMCRDWAFSNCGSGAASLLAADVRKMWRSAERRFVGHVCLRNPFLQLLLGIPIINFLQEAGSWERQYALRYGCIMPTPSLQLPKNLSHAEKRRVWSRSCGSYYLLQCSGCALSCATRLLQTNEHLSRLSF